MTLSGTNRLDSISQRVIPFGVLLLIPFSSSVEVVSLYALALVFFFLCQAPARTALYKNLEIRLWTVAFACFFVPVVCSVIDAEHAQRAWEKGVGLLRIYAIGLALIWAFRNEQIRDFLLLGITLVLVFWMFDGYYEVLTGRDWLDRAQYPGRINGPFDRPKLGYHLAVLFLLPTLWLFNKNKWFGLAFFSAATLLVILSADRGGWVHMFWTLTIPAAVLMILNRSMIKQVLMAGFILLLGLAIAYQTVNGVKSEVDRSLDSIVGGVERFEARERARYHIFETAISMYLGNPVNGIGFRGYRFAYNNYADAPAKLDRGFEASVKKTKGSSHPHSVPLQFAAEMGTIGIVGYLALLFLSIAKLWEVVKAKLALASAAWVGWISAIFPFNSSLDIGSSGWGIYVWFLLALAICLTQMERRQLRADA